MMHWDFEAPLRTEVRLRTALQNATARILPQAYMWHPIATAPGQSDVGDDVIAMARSDRGWCQLAPAHHAGEGEGEGETWALISLQFERGAQLEGFLDWFASRLRRRVDPRLIVANGICGSSHFAFWGVPERHREALCRELSILTSSPAPRACGVGLL